jgi:hypothetical protein
MEKDIEIVLGLADMEIQAQFESARKHGDLDLEESAKRCSNALSNVEGLIKNAPKLLLALKHVLQNYPLSLKDEEYINSIIEG